MVILDTNIIIDHLRQLDSKQTIYQKLLKKYSCMSLGICTISIQELFVGKSTRNRHAQLVLVKSLKGLKIYSHTASIAKLAGEITRDLNNQVKFADAAIAASAIHHGASLATLNTKDFAGIPHLKLLSL